MATIAAEPTTPRPLMGTDESSMDDKGRILVPKKKRDRIGEKFVLAITRTSCLAAYSEATWEKMVGEILDHESINFGTEQYTRLIIGSAEDDLKFDAQGRFVVPQKMREAARIKDKVLLVGCGDRMEIWASEEYEFFQRDPESYGLQRREAVEKAYRQMKGL